MRNDSLEHRHGRHHRQPDPVLPDCRCTTRTASPTTRWSRPTRRCTTRRSTSPTPTREEGFDFSGTRNFDKKTGYRSKSFLTVPMKNHEDEIIGVLQLINAMDRGTGEVIAVLRRRPAPGRVARLAGRHRADQPAADQAARGAVRVLHQPDQHRDRRQIALYRRPLRARAGAHHDAGRGGQRHRGRPARGLPHDRQGPLRAEDRRPAARLRQDHHAGARGGQGHQAADHLRPHPPGRHALRGAQARCRDRHAARASSAPRNRATMLARSCERA